MLVPVFGINGVGKDSVISGLDFPGLLAVSKSRILMIELGILKSLSQEINEHHYRALEATPENIVLQAKESLVASISQLAACHVLVLSAHLVIAKFTGGQEELLPFKAPPWLFLAHGMILLESRAVDILERRRSDKQRGRPVVLAQIEKHLRAEQEAWRTISRGKIPCMSIMNQQGKLSDAVVEAQRFIESL